MKIVRTLIYILGALGALLLLALSDLNPLLFIEGYRNFWNGLLEARPSIMSWIVMLALFIAIFAGIIAKIELSSKDNR
jgi:NhaP-type Na+/H+ or K+/H+ antiporter